MPGYPAAWGPPALPGPHRPAPARTAPGKSSELAIQAKQAAAKQRKEKANQARLQQRRQEGLGANTDLFDAPVRTVASQDFDVEKVMGAFTDAHNIINKHNVFGVDYQPATPAPAHQHIIGGGDDEEETAAGGRPPPRRPPFPGHNRPPLLRPPSHPPRPHQSQPARQPPQKAPAPPPTWAASMAPPSVKSVKQQAVLAPPQHKPRPSPLKIPEKRQQPSLSSASSLEDDESIQAIFQEMKHPYQGELGGLPTPLTGILTPRVEPEEMGSQRHQARYQGGPPAFNTNPFRVNAIVSQSPSKSKNSPEKPPELVVAPPKPLHSKESSSSAESDSSESESGESDGDKDDPNKHFGLGNLLGNLGNSPLGGRSERSVSRPTPSPRYQPTPSPGLAGKEKVEPASPHCSIPSLLDPLSPLNDGPNSPLVPHPDRKLSVSDTASPDVKTKEQKSKVKPPVHCSSDESQDNRKPRKPLKKSRSSSKVKEAPSLQKGLSRSSRLVESDSEQAGGKLQPRSFSSSPAKRVRPGYSSPGRERLPATQPLPSDSDEEPRPSPPHKTPEKHKGASPKPSAAASSTKSSIMSKIFKGAKSGGGGKGKGKGKNGGITVIAAEESDYIEYESSTQSKSSLAGSRPEKGGPVEEEEKPPPSPQMIGERDKGGGRSGRENREPGWAGLQQDLNLSEEEEEVEVAAPARTRLICSIPFQRLGRTLAQLQNRLRGSGKMSGKRQAGKQECWITSGDERAGNGRKRKPSERGGEQRSKLRECERSSVSGGLVESSSEPGSRKRREPSPVGPQQQPEPGELSNKRLKSESAVSPALSAGGCGWGGEPAPPDPALAGPSPAWPGCLMPPPSLAPAFPTKRVYYSYFERRTQEWAETEDEEENVVEEAKRLKHEADQETNMGTKCRKYLQAIMKFSECGDRTEQMGDKSVAYNIYNQTLQVNKFLNKLNNSSKKGVRDVDIRLVVLSMRAQSLLNLRLYKMKQHELKNYQRTIQDALAKSDTDCCLSIPKTVMQNQHEFYSYLSQCHELWEQADVYVSKSQREDFFIELDQVCGPLTLNSTLKELVNYTRHGLASIGESDCGRGGGAGEG